MSTSPPQTPLTSPLVPQTNRSDLQQSDELSMPSDTLTVPMSVNRQGSLPTSACFATMPQAPRQATSSPAPSLDESFSAVSIHTRSSPTMPPVSINQSEQYNHILRLLGNDRAEACEVFCKKAPSILSTVREFMYSVPNHPSEIEISIFTSDLHYDLHSIASHISDIDHVSLPDGFIQRHNDSSTL